MVNPKEMIIWINKRYYAQLDLVPVLNETDVYVNPCTLVDSQEKKSLETIAFNSDYIIPILQSKDTNRFKEIGHKIREMAAKHHVYPLSSTEMPKGIKQKGGKLYERKA